MIDKTSGKFQRISLAHDRLYHVTNNEIRIMKDDPMCSKYVCSNTSFCFLGACFCHPGYEGDECTTKINPSNPWYTKSCPNLLSTSTADMTVPLHLLGGEHTQVKQNSKDGSANYSSVENNCAGLVNPTACAYLCYSHPLYGTAVVPNSLWHAAQDAEGNLC